jgi:hypothetical protein
MPRNKVQDSTGALKGWKAIAGHLGIPAATAQRWARDGMPVRRQGRFTVADATQLRDWLGREAHMLGPAQVMAGNADVGEALRASIAAVLKGAQERLKAWVDEGGSLPLPG